MRDKDDRGKLYIPGKASIEIVCDMTRVLNEEVKERKKDEELGEGSGGWWTRRGDDQTRRVGPLYDGDEKDGHSKLAVRNFDETRSPLFNYVPANVVAPIIPTPDTWVAWRTFVQTSSNHRTHMSRA